MTLLRNISKNLIFLENKFNNLSIGTPHDENGFVTITLSQQWRGERQCEITAREKDNRISLEFPNGETCSGIPGDLSFDTKVASVVAHYMQ